MVKLRARLYSEKSRDQNQKAERNEGGGKIIRCDRAYQTNVISQRDKTKGNQVLQRTLKKVKTKKGYK